MFETDIVITNFTINNNIINTKSNMTYNTWTMININSTIFTDRTITNLTILEIKTDNNNIIVSEFNSSIISKRNNTIIFTDNSVRNTIKIIWDYLTDLFAFLRLSSA